MDSPKMAVEHWRNSPLPTFHARRAPRRYLPQSLIGILGTALLHVILIQSIVLGGGSHSPKPTETQDAASTLAKSSADAG